VRLVIGAFTTLSEAEAATQALLDAGHRDAAIAAYGRTGGGRLLLAGRVPVQPVGDPARLVSRAERARAWAAVGAVIGIFVALALLGAAHVTSAGLFWELPNYAYASGWPAWGAFVLMLSLIGAGLAALARRTDGLPHDLAYRYGMRLDQGDTVVAVKTNPGSEARAAQELLGLQGAVFSDVTRGAVEPRDPVLPTPTLAPSQN
jgi:hypothetical protein